MTPLAIGLGVAAVGAALFALSKRGGSRYRVEPTAPGGFKITDTQSGSVVRGAKVGQTIGVGGKIYRWNGMTWDVVPVK